LKVVEGNNSYKMWVDDLEQWKRSCKTKIVGRNVVTLKTIDSTNTYLKNREDLPNGTIVIAYQQSEGKGQKTKKWNSNPGGLYFTIKLSFAKIPTISPFWLLAGATIGLCKGINSMGLQPQIKWPNDIIINKKKIAGVLGEFIYGKEIFNAYLGIGININNPLSQILLEYPSLEGKITSLSHEMDERVSGQGKFIPYSLLLEKISYYLDEQINSISPFAVSLLKPIWNDYAQIYNQKIVFEDLDTGIDFVGVAKGLTDYGSLLILNMDSNETLEFTTGDIRIKSI
jgi:BirA family biotin operon repressor/biotin-[acetyl-CoA-carboxylase] ligase